MPQRNRRDDSKRIRVVAECRDHPDHTMLSIALFGWVMDKLRAEQQHTATVEPTKNDNQKTEGGDI